MTKKYPIITEKIHDNGDKDIITEIRKGKFLTDEYRQLENGITQLTTQYGEKSQTRQVTKFLKLPKTIFGKTRWLCKASWEEKRIETTLINWFNPLLGGPRLGWSEWTPTKWI
jgi:hypothetical protein